MATITMQSIPPTLSFHPQYSLEDRLTKPKRAPLQRPPFLPSSSAKSLSFSHPDEERGRKFTMSATAPGGLSFGAPASSVGGDEEGEDAWNEEEWSKDRGGSGWTFLKPQVVGWGSALAKALENPSGADGIIDLCSKEISDIPDEIRQLALLTNLSPTRTFQHLQQHQRSSSGINPAKFGRTFGRCSSETYTSSPTSTVPVKLYLSSNNITSDSISHTLFSVLNLRVLSLRSNKLTFLPPGIGRLIDLNELNLAFNSLTFLPAEILLLTALDQVVVSANPFLLPPTETFTPLPVSSPAVLDGEAAKPTSNEKTPSKRLLSPLVIHFTIPSLREICNRHLLSLRSTFTKPTPFPAHLQLPFLTTFDSLPSRPHSSFLEETSHTQPFDPLSNICRSPLHAGEEVIYYKHAVERMEWVQHSALIQGGMSRGEVGKESDEKKNKKRIIPLLHRGCSLRCLDWLEGEV